MRETSANNRVQSTTAAARGNRDVVFTDSLSAGNNLVLRGVNGSTPEIICRWKGIVSIELGITKQR